MEKWVFTIRGNTNGKMASLPEIAIFARHKLASLGVLLITEVSLIKINKAIYEYTFYANFHEAVADYVAKKLLETFDSVCWKKLTPKESSNGTNK